MAGNVAGGKAAAKTNKTKYGSDFYARIGSAGGKLGNKDGVVKGFARNPELARTAGALGGKSKAKATWERKDDESQSS